MTKSSIIPQTRIWTMRTTTKMYLSVVLSTLCIIFYQYQLSKANFITLQRNDVSGSITNYNQNAVGRDIREVIMMGG